MKYTRLFIGMLIGIITASFIFSSLALASAASSETALQANGGSAITLNKTVGTNPVGCATTDSISVLSGTDVTYCYEIANTGSVTLTLHDLDDSELGPILSGFAFDLVPGASFFVTQTANIIATTINTATWTAYNAGPTDVATATDTAEVVVASAASYPICADFETGSLPNFMFMETTSNGAANGRVQVTNNNPHTGLFAVEIDTDCDGCGGLTQQSTTMLVDLLGQSGVVLDFWVQEFGDENNPEDGVFISDDGGTTWALIQSLNNFSGTYTHVILDLDAATSGAGMNYVDGFMIRFQSLDNFSIATDGYAFDDICVQPFQPNISVTPSALHQLQNPDEVMTNSITIANTGTLDLNWSIDESPTTCDSPGTVPWMNAVPTSGTTVVDGSDAVDVVFDSTGFSPYEVYTATLCVNSDDPDTPTVSVPVTLTAPGLLTAIPDSFDVTIALGTSNALPLHLTNIGGLDVAFEIVEQNGGMTTTLPTFGQFDLPSEYAQHAQDDATAVEAREHGALPVAPTLAAGDVLNFWSTGLPIAWGVAFGIDSGDVWVSSPAPAWGGNNTFNQYDQNGVPGTTHPYTWTPTNGPADATYNPNTGTYWVMNVNSGVANCIFEMDAIGGYTGTMICPGGGTGFATSQRGLAYDAVNDQYFAGSWNDSSIHRFLPDGTILESVNVGLAIAGLAYNPETDHLFVMVNADPNPVYVLDVANGYSVVGQFSISQDFGAFSGGGLAIDCEGNLWAADQITGNVYEIDSGEIATSLCAGDIPWLHQNPVTGTVAVSSSLDVDITFDATVVTQTGQYFGIMQIKDDTPNAAIQIPVSMTVITNANFGVEVVSGVPLSGDPGTTVTHTLWVTNAGNVLDTLNLSVAGNSWNTVLSPASIGLLPGDSTMVTAWVTIPADAAGGEVDIATVTVTSQGDPGISGSADVTTIANVVPGVQLGSTNTTMTGSVGTVVTYSVWITNTGNTTDSFDIAVSGTWTATTSLANIVLSGGASAQIWISVEIPAGATSGEMDTTTVTATSSGSGANDSIVLTTTAVFVPAPSITLIKTVGVGAGTCATTTTITVTVGTIVYYCYEVTNTGNITLSLHDLDDDQLGSLLSGLAYDLAPGASVDTVAAGLTISATIMTDTVNTATWTAYNAGPADVATAEASAMINIEVDTGPQMYYIYLPIVVRNE